MVQVPVCDQEAVQPSESKAGFQDLPLCAFSAVHQEAVLIVLDHLGWQATVSGRS